MYTRGCVGRNFSTDWGNMCNLAFIAATILNFGLAWPEISPNADSKWNGDVRE